MTTLLAATLGSSRWAGSSPGNNANLQRLDQFIAEGQLTVNGAFLNRTCSTLVTGSKVSASVSEAYLSANSCPSIL